MQRVAEETPIAEGEWQSYDVSARTKEFLSKNKRMYIDGAWVEGADGETFRSFDPATGSDISCLPAASKQDVSRAVSAARCAFEKGPWRDYLPAERERLLMQLADLMEQHRQPIAEIETIDNGKPLAEALASADGTIAYIRYMAGWSTKVSGMSSTLSDPNCAQAYTRREPVGVVGAIIPWNLPISMAAWKVIPPLVTGCTVVLKPAEQTSLSAIYLAELIEEVGFPKGVFNLITGMGSTAGAELASHPGINKIAFTGSTLVGKSIAHAAAGNLSRVSLELGGKSPVIVLEDCNLEVAARGAADAIFYNQGQVCCAGSRLYVQRGLYDRVVAEVAAIADSIKLAPGLEPGCQMGPLVSAEQQNRVSNYIESGLEEGASLATQPRPAKQTGYFVSPTVLSDTSNEMKVVKEEIFGPVLVAAPFESIDEAIELANDTPYGLGASIWSDSLSNVHSIIPKLRAGNVWVNTHNLVDPSLPFGGMKASGYGRELGSEQLDAYLETKSVWIAS